MSPDLLEWDEAARWWNTQRPLTHSSDSSREGLAMKATQDAMSKSYTATCPSCGESRKLACRPRGLVCKPCASRMNGALVSEMERPGVSVRLLALCREVDGGCWEWIGTRKRDGYGYVWHEGRAREAHRVSYEVFVGPIPPGLQIDHLCRNKPCINPAHLEPVTGKVNTQRAREARKAVTSWRC